MKLTYRQKAFLSKLLEVYRETGEPVHYSIIARKLGLNNSTAYDMLRILEQKGAVVSRYDTPKETSGPGRSNIRFIPTAEGIEHLAYLTGNIREQDGWEDVKARIFANLSRAKDEGYRDVLEELITKMRGARSSLVQCAEAITALLLSLREAGQGLIDHDSVGNLLKAPASRLRMSILAGLVMGLSAADHKAKKLGGIRQEYAEKYEAALQELSRDSLKKLHRFTRDVWYILKAPVN